MAVTGGLEVEEWEMSLNIYFRWNHENRHSMGLKLTYAGRLEFPIEACYKAFVFLFPSLHQPFGFHIFLFHE